MNDCVTMNIQHCKTNCDKNVMDPNGQHKNAIDSKTFHLYIKYITYHNKVMCIKNRVQY